MFFFKQKNKGDLKNIKMQCATQQMQNAGIVPINKKVLIKFSVHRDSLKVIKTGKISREILK